MRTDRVDSTKQRDEITDSNIELTGAEGLVARQETEEEERAKLEWLRVAAREGFDAIDHGDYVTLNSPEEIKQFLREIHEEVAAELAAERRGA